MEMFRAAAVLTAFVLCASTARADTIDRNVSQLHSSKGSYKVRLAAALALSKSKDPRAIIALADAVLATCVRRDPQAGVELCLRGRDVLAAAAPRMSQLLRPALNP